MATIIAGTDANAAVLLSSCLNEKGIAIAPCDTIYGILGCAPRTETRIREIKGRGEEKPFILLHATVESVLAAADTEVPAPLLALWPGPLTLILKAGIGKTGFRVPADSFLLDVLKRTGPLFSTSVNRSGETPLWRIADITAAFGGNVDMIVDGGDLPGKRPSTIIDLSEKPFTILRHGAAELSDEVLGLCK
ncbi:MAG: L-threonylcarbamoyladenylate synthase [Spirochaetales bacterium]|nr:L-threonylcarbamoyladenylate synthase [Spirochaetales bacterium]